MLVKITARRTRGETRKLKECSVPGAVEYAGEKDCDSNTTGGTISAEIARIIYA